MNTRIEMIRDWAASVWAEATPQEVGEIIISCRCLTPLQKKFLEYHLETEFYGEWINGKEEALGIQAEYDEYSDALHVRVKDKTPEGLVKEENK